MQTGRLVMILGAVVFVIGVVIYFAGRFGLNLGQLPGDIRIERGNFTCVFPLATMILLSIILTVGLNLLVRFLNK
jgi:hypothetical protein